MSTSLTVGRGKGSKKDYKWKEDGGGEIMKKG